VIGDLGCEINRDSKRHAQNIQGREERMAAQVTENVPPRDAKILRSHVAVVFTLSEWKLTGKNAFAYLFF